MVWRSKLNGGREIPGSKMSLQVDRPGYLRYSIRGMLWDGGSAGGASGAGLARFLGGRLAVLKAP